MREQKSPGVGILRSTKARHAEDAIGESEGLVTVLRLTQADIKPAMDALRIAKKFFEAHQYSKAFHAAKKAESLAIALDERFAAYQKAENELRSRIASMRHLGLRTEQLHAILGRAEEMILSGIWENGSFVPNYLEARVLLERSEQEGRLFQEKAERASNGIFMAELAIESLGDMKGPLDPIAFARGATAALEQSLQDAIKELVLGNADGAALIGKDIEAKATRLKTQYADATRCIEETETQMAFLRGEGVLTEGHEGQVKMARDMLANGMIEPAAAMATRIQSEVDGLGESYRKAAMGLADTEVIYGRLQREGFRSYEADVAIRDARRAIRERNYDRALQHLARALHAFARRTSAREALAKAIQATRRRVQLLDGAKLSFLPDIQEVLTRAQREFQQGNFSASSEDLRIATVLLDQVARTPTPKK